jgi:integrase
LGFKLRNTAAQLIEFASFLEQKAAPYITTALALEWAMQHVDHQPSTWTQRLGFVRVFARHWSASDPRTEIPPTGLLPFRAQRVRPYLYTEEEIQRLLAAAKGLPPSNGLRPRTYHCLFGLLAVSGLRISEAIKLERKDVDLNEGLLIIRQTPSAAIGSCQLRAHPAFCSTIITVAWKSSTVRRTFYNLSRQIGLRGPVDHTGPRLHDFRHRFALMTLIRWYRAGEDIERRLPMLSTLVIVKIPVTHLRNLVFG